MKKTSFSIFLIYVLTIFNIQAANAITNGIQAAPGLAVNVFTSKGQCTGVIWKNNIVITAAHCVIDSAGVLKTSISVGIYQFREWIYSDVVGVKVPANYKGSGLNPYEQSSNGDIAFLILKEDFYQPPLSLDLKIATLSDWETYKQSPTWLEVFGYGYTSDSGPDVPTTVPISAMFTIDVGLSASNNKDWGALNSSSSATCHGDSGGPVIYYRAAEKALVLVGITTGTTFLSTTANCGTLLFGSSSSLFTKLSSYSGLAESAINTEARYRASALVVNSALETLEGYRNSTSELSDFVDLIPPTTGKRLITNNKNVSAFQKLVDDYESKLNTYEEALTQSMDFVYINSGVLEANSPEISGNIETNLKKYELKIDVLINKIRKTLPLFVCSNNKNFKDLPASKKCPKGYEKLDLPLPFGDS